MSTWMIKIEVEDKEMLLEIERNIPVPCLNVEYEELEDD
tara:strand:+ start:1887 stop:2003 length:117 start_codon:yes stop_codon:yes gene_type:complete